MGGKIGRIPRDDEPIVDEEILDGVDGAYYGWDCEVVCSEDYSLRFWSCAMRCAIISIYFK